MNQTALAFAGATRQQVEGQPLWDAPWWAHSATMREELRAAIQAMAAGEFVRFEAIHLRCDAKTRYFDFSLTSIKKDDGRIEYLIAEGRDVTDLLNAEKENAALAEKLAHARRLEAIGRLAAAVAHDFNNLLVAIMGSVEAVRADVERRFDGGPRPASDRAGFRERRRAHPPAVDVRAPPAGGVGPRRRRPRSWRAVPR